MRDTLFVAVVNRCEQLLKYFHQGIQRAVTVIEQKLRKPVSLDVFHDDVKVSFVEKVLLNLDDVGMVEVLEVLDLFDGVDFVFFLYGNDFADSFDFTDPVDHFTDQTGGAAIDNLGKMVKLKHLADVVSHKLPVTYLELIRVRLGCCRFA